MKDFPLDQKSVEELTGGFNLLSKTILLHDREQRAQIQTLKQFVMEAMQFEGAAETAWFEDVQDFLNESWKIANEQEGARFNRSNGHKIPRSYETPAEIVKRVADASESDFEEKKSSSSEEMTEEDLGAHFGTTPTPKPRKDRLRKPLSKMSVEELDDLQKAEEEAADNSNDIYKVKARVANLARMNGVVLTPQGEMLVNTYVHSLLALYSFAESIKDKGTREALIKVIRAQESMPANLIKVALPPRK